MMYAHIYIGGKNVRTWRVIDAEIPKVGDEIVFSSSKFDIRYLVKSVELANESSPVLYRIHCEDLTKEFYGPFRRETFDGAFHKLDKTIMKMYPEFTKNDYMLE